ncbi:Protein disulfide-isomerase A4 [Thelohanellus kitauei]|uniref:Protein disulfide-isomerase A4 n=1 Tax=Thelohanellus kitauei TaxID=669202 RepID=A0A0C2NCS4_THEKT|nr:Protein disulfide-isomerase A4 [Thelohanellus kitauei]
MLLILLFYFVILLYSVRPDDEDEKWMDINPEDDVHLVYFNNYSTIFHMKTKWIAYVYNSSYDVTPGALYDNYAKVAKNLRGQIFFTRLDGGVVANVIEDYLTTVPGLIFFSNKTAYAYEGSYSYDELLQAIREFSSSNWIPPHTEIINLNKENFDILFNNITYGIVFGYSLEDETHYWAYMGRLKTVADKLKLHNIFVYAINKNTDSEILERLGIRNLGVPKLIRNGKLYPISFRHQNQIKSMVEYVLKGRKFPSQSIKDHKTGVYLFSKIEDEYIGMFLAVIDEEGNYWHKVFEELVFMTSDDFIYFHTFNKQAGLRFGCAERNCLITIFPDPVKSPYDDQYQKLFALNPQQLGDLDTVLKHVRKACRPLVGYFNNYMSVQNIYQGMYPRGILFMDVDFEEYEYKENLYFIRFMWRLAIEFTHVTFVYANREDHTSLLNDLKLIFTPNFADFVIQKSNKYNYVFEGQYNHDQLKVFVESVLNGTKRPVYKSEEIPPTPYDVYGIRQLVGNNFEKIVFSEVEDVVVLLSVNDCEKCDAYNQIFITTRKIYADFEGLEFGRFDLDNNMPPPEYHTDSHPAIFFASITNKMKPIQFDDELKNSDQLITFINKYTKTLRKKVEKAKEDL